MSLRPLGSLSRAGSAFYPIFLGVFCYLLASGLESLLIEHRPTWGCHVDGQFHAGKFWTSAPWTSSHTPPLWGPGRQPWPGLVFRLNTCHRHCWCNLPKLSTDYQSRLWCAGSEWFRIFCTSGACTNSFAHTPRTSWHLAFLLESKRCSFLYLSKSR